MAAATPKRNKKKKSALLRYATRLPTPKQGKPPYAGRTPSGEDRRAGKGSASGARAANADRKRATTPTRVNIREAQGARRVAPGSSLAGFADALVPKGRLPSRYYRGQEEQSILNPAFNPGMKVPGMGGGSWFQNLGKDALSIVTGLPGTIALAARTAATPFTSGYGETLGRVPGAPLGGAARSFSAGVGKDLWTAADAAGDDLRYRYGPLFEGDFGKFGARVKEHPGFTALDVASVASLGAGAAAKGASIGSKLGRATTAARHTKAGKAHLFPSNQPPPGPKSSIVSRVAGVPKQAAGPTRMPTAGAVEKILTAPKLQRVADSRKLKRRERSRNITTMDANVVTKEGGLVKGVLPNRSVKLRNYAASPLARGYQKAGERVMGKVESLSNKGGGKTMRGKDRFFSTSARDQRALRYEARQKNRREENMRDEAVHVATRDFAKEVLYRRGITKDKNAEVLVTLRADNIAIPKGDKTASQRVEEHLALVERELHADREKGIDAEALRGQEANVELLKGLLQNKDLIDNPTPTIVKATDETRRVRSIAQDYRSRTGGRYGIRGQTRARAGAYREAVGTGQARFFEDYDGIINPERREAIIEKGVEHVPAKAVTQAARTMYRGRDVDWDSSVGRRVRELLDEGYLPRPGSSEANMLLEGSRLSARVSDSLRARHSGRVPLTPDRKIDTKAKEKQYLSDAALRVQLDDPQNLFRPGEGPSPGDGARASMPVGYAAGHRGAAKSNFGYGELGRADKRATGHAYAGRDSYSRESTYMGLQRAVNSFYTMESVKHTIQTFALRMSGSNKPRVFRSQEAASQLDADKWTLVSTRSLEHLVEEIDTLDPSRRVSALSAFDDSATIQKAFKDGDDAVVAIPTVLAKEIRQMVDDPHGLMKKYDSVLSIWRAGILAYTPRWFLNNLVGTSIFMGVMSGFDLRAIAQANRNSKFVREGAVPHRAESVSHSMGIAESGSDIGRGGLDPQSRSRFMRGAHRMFLLNQRLEGRLRRAAYLSRARRNLRTEGRLKRGASDDEMFDAMIKMPDDLKQQTLRDMEFFVGQYKSYGRVEKRVLRRIIPFWSWMRVINTWAFGLPFKSPLRAEALRVGATMAAALEEYPTEGLPLWEQGRMTLPGGLAFRTNNLNPLFSVAEEISAVTGAGDPGQALTDLSRVAAGSMSPPIQYAMGQVSGRNPFGTRDYTHPVGDFGTTSRFGWGQQRRNPVTGEIEDYHGSPNPMEQLFEMLPFAGPIRQALSGQRQPYDTSSTLDLALGKLGLRDEEPMYQPPPKTPRGRGRLPYGLGSVAGVAGLPVYTLDREAEERAINKQRLDYLESQKQTAKLRAREAVRRAQEAGVKFGG